MSGDEGRLALGVGANIRSLRPPLTLPANTDALKRLQIGLRNPLGAVWGGATEEAEGATNES